MSILKFAAAVTLAASAQTALHGEKQCPGNVPSVPLRQVERALIVVSLNLSGAGPFDFLVDTGAQITTVDDRLAAQLALATKGVAEVSGVATYDHKALTQLGQVELGGHRVENVLATVDNLGQLHAADAKIRGILGEDFLAHFDLLIDNEHHVLCLDETGAMAAALKGRRVTLAQPYGPDHDLPFTRPLVIQVRLDGVQNPVLFRLDSGSNVPLVYAKLRLVRASTPGKTQIFRRVVDGEEQNFAVLKPQDLSLGEEKIREVVFVQPLNSIGAVREPREDGLLPTFLFQRVLVSYQNRFAILNPR